MIVYVCRCILRPENMFLRRSLAHISYMYMIFFFSSVGTFGGLATPNTKKLATLLHVAQVGFEGDHEETTVSSIRLVLINGHTKSVGAFRRESLQLVKVSGRLVKNQLGHVLCIGHYEYSPYRRSFCWSETIAIADIL